MLDHPFTSNGLYVLNPKDAHKNIIITNTPPTIVKQLITVNATYIFLEPEHESSPLLLFSIPRQITPIIKQMKIIIEVKIKIPI